MPEIMFNSQSDIAAHAGLTPQQFSDYVTGRRNALYSTARKIAEKLDCDDFIWTAPRNENEKELFTVSRRAVVNALLGGRKPYKSSTDSREQKLLKLACEHLSALSFKTPADWLDQLEKEVNDKAH